MSSSNSERVSGDAAGHGAGGSASANKSLAERLELALEAERRAGRGPDRRSGGSGESPTGLERRRGPGRRLSDFIKAAEEGELTGEQFLFLMAIEGFKKANNKTYPSWTDVLEVVRLLGYRKVQGSAITVRGAEDFTEAPDAAAAVRREKPVEGTKRAA